MRKIERIYLIRGMGIDIQPDMSNKPKPLYLHFNHPVNEGEHFTIEESSEFYNNYNPKILNYYVIYEDGTTGYMNKDIFKLQR